MRYSKFKSFICRVSCKCMQIAEEHVNHHDLLQTTIVNYIYERMNHGNPVSKTADFGNQCIICFPTQFPAANTKPFEAHGNNSWGIGLYLANISLDFKDDACLLAFCFPSKLIFLLLFFEQVECAEYKIGRKTIKQKIQSELHEIWCLSFDAFLTLC